MNNKHVLICFSVHSLCNFSVKADLTWPLGSLLLLFDGMFTLRTNAFILQSNVLYTYVPYIPGVGAASRTSREMSTELVLDCQIFADSREAALAESGDRPFQQTSAVGYFF